MINRASVNHPILVWFAIALLMCGAADLTLALTLRFLERHRRLPPLPERLERLSQAQERIIRDDILSGKARYLSYDPVLGWTILPQGYSSTGGVVYRANAQGIRGDTEFAERPAPGILRIVAVGDSFTHGDDVGNAETWEFALEAMSSKVEVLNLGVGGYGPDQALMRYQKNGLRYNPHIVLLGLFSEDLFRLVNIFRPFYAPDTGIPLAKPRFVLGPRGLALLPNPIADRLGYQELLEDPDVELPRLGINDYYYQTGYRRSIADKISIVRSARMLAYYAGRRIHSSDEILLDGKFNPASEAFRLGVAIVDEFRQTAAAHGAFPLVLLLPGKDDVRAYRKSGSWVFASLTPVLQKRGIAYLDLVGPFDKGPDLDALIREHYTAKGNEVVARSILNYIESNRLFARYIPVAGNMPLPRAAHRHRAD
jgi:hypothetical protein